MNIVLTTLNSKFIHSALAIRYLKSYTQDIDSNEIDGIYRQSKYRLYCWRNI